MSCQTYEAAIALNNAAVALVCRQRFRDAMSVLQDSIYLMNHVCAKTTSNCDGNGRGSSVRLQHDEDLTRRLILNAEKRLAVQLTDSSPIDPRFDVVVLCTDDMNPDTFMHSYRFNEMKCKDFVVHIMDDVYLECEDEEMTGWYLRNYDVHSAIILYNYAVACRLCSFNKRIINDALSLKKVNDSSMKLFHLSYTILQRELEYLPSSDQIPDENEEVWQVTSCVYYMVMLVLHYLADLNNLSGKQTEREIFLNELDRLSNNYTIYNGMICNDTNYDLIGNIVTAPAA